MLDLETKWLKKLWFYRWFWKAFYRIKEENFFKNTWKNNTQGYGKEVYHIKKIYRRGVSGIKFNIKYIIIIQIFDINICFLNH